MENKKPTTKIPGPPAGQLVESAGVDGARPNPSVEEALQRTSAKVMAALMASTSPQATADKVSQSVPATPTSGIKRKERTPPSKKLEDEDAALTKMLRNLWDAYAVVKYEVEVAMGGRDVPFLRDALEGLRESLDQVITERGELRSPSQKKVKQGTEPQAKETRVETADASTDTPCWWPVVESKSPPTLSAPVLGHSGVKKRNGVDKATGPPEGNRRRRVGQKKDTNTSSGEGAPPVAADARTTVAHGDSSGWTTVVRSGRKKKKDVAEKPADPAKPARPARRKTISAAALVKRRTPETQAVSISRPREGKTFAEVMKDMTSKVDLKQLKVEVVNTRVSKAGAIVLEVRAKEEADRLAASVAAAIGDDAVVTRPTRRTPVLVLGIPEWMSPEEISREISRSDPDIEATGVTVRDNPGGGRVARMDVPMAAATRLAEARGIQVGWVRCRVKLLEKRAPRCYRCQEAGHVAARCTAAEKPTRCFGCNGEGHLARECPKKRSSQGLPAQEAAEDVP